MAIYDVGSATAFAAAVAGLTLLAVLVARRLQRCEHLRALALKHSCQPPVFEAGSLPLGLTKAWMLIHHHRSQTLLPYALHMFRELGDTYVSRCIGMDMVFTASPENIKHILQRRFDDFDVGPLRRHLFRSVTPEGIFRHDGPRWRADRKLFRVHFADTRSVVNLDDIEARVQAMMARISAPPLLSKDKDLVKSTTTTAAATFTSSPQPPAGSVDLQALFTALMTDILGVVAVGESVDALSVQPHRERDDLLQAFLFVKERMARCGLSRPRSWVADELRFRRASALIRQYTGRFLRRAVESRTVMQSRQTTSRAIAKTTTTVTRGVVLHKEDSLGTKESLPAVAATAAVGPCVEQAQKPSAVSFLQRTALDGHALSTVLDQTISIFLAGTDSVTALLSAAFWFMSRDAHVFRTLRSAVLERFSTRPPAHEELGSLMYLRHVLNESLRLMPPVPFNAKMANKDTWLPRGGGPDGSASMLVRKGQVVSYWSWASHRRPDVFGADADDFRPERWETIKEDTPGFIPFQPGPRVCPGQRVAIAITSYVIIRMMQTYTSIENRDEKEWTESLGLTLASHHGVHVALLSDRPLAFAS